MAKKESTFLNMVFTLLIVTLVASAALGFVYELTKEPIKSAKNAKKDLAIQRVMPEYTNNPSNDVKAVAVDNDTVYIYYAVNNKDTVGIAVETFTNEAFGGNMKLMVGFVPDGTIREIAVIEHKETPGLGDKILQAKSDWSVQFEGKNPDDFQISVKKDGGDVDAITASTITSRAYCDAVKRAYEVFKKGGITDEPGQ